jgi:hypothetical protein
MNQKGAGEQEERGSEGRAARDEGDAVRKDGLEEIGLRW